MRACSPRARREWWRRSSYLVLPLWCRWGSTLLAVHIAETGTPFNLVDTIFRSTQEGILALAAVRDSEGVPYDFQGWR